MILRYATLADLLARYSEQELAELTDLDNIPPTTVNEARVNTKLDDAQALIDGYVGQVYRLPLQGCVKPLTVVGGAVEYVAPPVLTRIACDLARYYLHDNLDPESEPYLRHKAAIKDLEAVAAGKTQLACPWGGSPGAVLGSDAQTQTDEVQFSFAPHVSYEGFR